MSQARNRTLGSTLAALVAGVCMLAPVSAHATPFELIYSGTFNTQEALNLGTAPTPTYFAAVTPFTVRARFDTSSPNLAPMFGGPFNGFRAYAPSSTIIDIAGTQFTVDSFLVNATAGVTVAIFDRNSFVPGRYGIGLFADPFGDGAGFVGDFMSASPDYTVNAITPTVFTNYAGVGHGSGVCLSGVPPACPRAVTPWVLRDANGAIWNLSFGNYEEDYPVSGGPGRPVGLLNSAQISAVPEPLSVGLMMVGIAGWAGSRLRTR